MCRLPESRKRRQNRRAEYLKGWTVVNWDKALANFKKAIARDARGYSRISAPPERSLREPDHRRKIEINMAIRAKHRERLHFRLDLRSAR
jgi:hypothetical protein